MSGDDFLRYCLTGMVVAESSGQSVGDVTREVLCVCHALAESRGKQELFVASLSGYLSRCDHGKTQLIAIRSLPIGLYHNNLPSVIEWSRDSALLSTDDPVVTVSSAAVALMGFLAKKEVPVGLWGHELCIPLAGLGLPPGLPPEVPVDDVFLGSIMRATAAAGADPAVYHGSDAVHEVVGSALFGCMASPEDFDLAVSMARISSGPYSACLAGGLMAIRNSPSPSNSVIPAIEALIFDVSSKFSS